ncbi:CAP domain-containing protein [Jeotgalibaca sp. A122]|uniref:CAP domain-containing protein n=1 Tax=Jeotgalibaca sp. A122 TaxID=3457322 RepID=UPI003FD55351
MRRGFRRIVTLLVLFLLAWYVFDTGFIQDKLIPKLNEILTVEEIQQEEPLSNSSFMRTPIEAPAEIDIELIRDTIFHLTNDLRREQGVGQLTQNEMLIQAADTRALETEQSFSHTRPNEDPFHTVLQGVYEYQMAGENLAMGTYHGTDTEMASFLFEGWVESEGHYQNMIEPGFTEIGVGVHYDGEMFYLVQIFGTPF